MILSNYRSRSNIFFNSAQPCCRPNIQEVWILCERESRGSVDHNFSKYWDIKTLSVIIRKFEHVDFYSAWLVTHNHVLCPEAGDVQGIQWIEYKFSFNFKNFNMKIRKFLFDCCWLAIAVYANTHQTVEIMLSWQDFNT